jgi:hypothetical protein
MDPAGQSVLIPDHAGGDELSVDTRSQNSGGNSQGDCGADPAGSVDAALPTHGR